MWAFGYSECLTNILIWRLTIDLTLMSLSVCSMLTSSLFQEKRRRWRLLPRPVDPPPAVRPDARQVVREGGGPAQLPRPRPGLQRRRPQLQREPREVRETVNTERTNSPCQKLTDRGVPKIVEYFQKLLKPDPSELFVTAIQLWRGGPSFHWL